MITDWDDAYTNGAYIDNGADYPNRWALAARDFRDRMLEDGRAELDIRYGAHERELFDLFSPAHKPTGLVVFVHGGYWLAFDKSVWSHLALGAVAKGWSVAMPSYPLAPEAKVPRITQSVAKAIAAASERVSGPIRLAGHSAGGHLVTRMVCKDALLDDGLRERIVKVVSISGLHDLRPLLKTKMADKLFDEELDAVAESPALQLPTPGIDVSCWVGTDERPEFIRQNEILQKVWLGPDIKIRAVSEPHRHHFNIIDGMAELNSSLLKELLE